MLNAVFSLPPLQVFPCCLWRGVWQSQGSLWPHQLCGLPPRWKEVGDHHILILNPIQMITIEFKCSLKTTGNHCAVSIFTLNTKSSCPSDSSAEPQHVEWKLPVFGVQGCSVHYMDWIFFFCLQLQQRGRGRLREDSLLWPTLLWLWAGGLTTKDYQPGPLPLMNCHVYGFQQGFHMKGCDPEDDAFISSLEFCIVEICSSRGI